MLLAPIFTTNEKDNSLTRNDPNILGDCKHFNNRHKERRDLRQIFVDHTRFLRHWKLNHLNSNK